MNEPVLSVLVISHNQKDLLRRCVESILAQDLPFEHEIVISDDASSDGTWELAQDYSRTVPCVKAYRCDSNDCCPTMTSERSGHNRSNAYKHSSGKYFTHIDADDYYRPGAECLKLQVALLEGHPECSICMQKESPSSKSLITGRIITAEEYIGGGMFSNNGTMMMRRYAGVDPSEIYHKWYVDTVITNHHLQFGSIVCLDRSDWVYVQDSQSITSSLKQNDRALLWPLAFTVYPAELIPRFRFLYYSDYNNLKGLLSAVKRISQNISVSDACRAFFAQFKGVFLFRAAASEKKSLPQNLRLTVIECWLKMMIVSGATGKCIVTILDRLCR